MKTYLIIPIVLVILAVGAYAVFSEVQMQDSTAIRYKTYTGFINTDIGARELIIDSSSINYNIYDNEGNIIYQYVEPIDQAKYDSIMGLIDSSGVKDLDTNHEFKTGTPDMGNSELTLSANGLDETLTLSSEGDVAAPQGLLDVQSEMQSMIDQFVQTPPLDFTHYGYDSIVAGQIIMPDQAYDMSAGKYVLHIPAGTFDAVANVELLSANPDSIMSYAPDGERPILAFALRVTDQSTGNLIESFNKPITMSVNDQMITASSNYYNVDKNGGYTLNDKGMVIEGDQLSHPIAGTGVGWVITEPTTQQTGSFEPMNFQPMQSKQTPWEIWYSQGNGDFVSTPTESQLAVAFYNDAYGIQLQDFRKVNTAVSSECDDYEMCAPYHYTANIDSKYRAVMSDLGWDEVGPDFSVASSEQAGLSYIEHSPTYAYDGSGLSMTGYYEMQHNLPEGNYTQYVIAYTFDSTHPGYGNRTGESLALTTTTHDVNLILMDGEVISASMDGKYDMVSGQMFNETLMYDPVQCQTTPWDQGYSNKDIQFSSQPSEAQIIDGYYLDTYGIGLTNYQRVDRTEATCTTCGTCVQDYFVTAQFAPSDVPRMIELGWQQS